MSYAEQFVIANNLRPADVILLRKKFMGMFDHFVVYLGRHAKTNRPVFAANYSGGVQVVKDHEINQFLQKLEPEKVDRFHGTEHQRREAVQRAISMIGKAVYHLIFSNCEHYKNFVQFGRKYSKQVDAAGETAMVAGGVTALAGLASKNGTVAIIGLILLALGGIALSAANQDE